MVSRNSGFLNFGVLIVFENYNKLFFNLKSDQLIQLIFLSDVSL